MTTTDPTKLADELERAAKGSTPGPWEYETDQEGSSMGWVGRQIQYHPERSYTVFSSMFEVEGDSAEQAINAELVVTMVNNLPAILDALRRPTPPPDVAKVEKAIKAARCEPGCHSYDTPTDWSNPYCSCQAKAKAAIAALQETKP